MSEAALAQPRLKQLFSSGGEATVSGWKCLDLAVFTCQKNGSSDTIWGWVHAATLSTC